MAYLDVKSFNYDGISSDTFNLGIGWFEGDLENDTSTGLGVELKRGEMNMVRTEPNQYGAIYNDTLTFEFAIFDKNNISFTAEQSHALNKWLRKSNVYKKLVFYDDKYQTSIFYAVCTEVVDAVYNGVNGKKLTFVCNSPFGFAPKSKRKETVVGSKTFVVNNLSDQGVYYPTLTITSSDGNEVSVKNESDDDQTMTVTFDNVSNNKIIIDSKRCTLTDDEGKIVPAYKVGWTAESIYWPRLIEGKNTFTITGNCEIVFELEFPRKVGTA